jgi:hypothetical protein
MLLLVAIAIAAPLYVGSLLLGGIAPGAMMPGGGMPWGSMSRMPGWMLGQGWPMWAGGLAATFVWGIVIASGVLLLLSFGESTRGDDAPLAVLQRRLAAGEIGLDEYEHLRAAITSK